MNSFPDAGHMFKLNVKHLIYMQARPQACLLVLTLLSTGMSGFKELINAHPDRPYQLGHFHWFTDCHQGSELASISFQTASQSSNCTGLFPHTQEVVCFSQMS